jgi:chromosome segregation ATPase
MTTERPSQEHKDPCAECDLGEIDKLTCTAKKIERQAEVTKESLEQLDNRRDQFKAAKDAYTTAWTTAKADVDAANDRLQHLLKDLGCRLSDASKGCLREQWGRVKGEIEECGSKPGCREFDCEFDDSVGENETQAALAGRIQELRQRAEDLDAYFQTLVDLQASLPQQAAQARQAVEALASDTAADTEGKNALKLYARALVLEWTLHAVWGGFKEIQVYLDCLCATLTCLLKAWTAIVTLEGAKAERKCKDDRQQERCDALRANPVIELLDRYEKECKEYEEDKGAATTTAV